MRGWRRCCRARRACCDCAGRLRRRQPDVGAKGLQHAGRSFLHADDAGRVRRRGGDRRAGRGSFRRHRRAGCVLARGDFRRGGQGHAALRHLRRHAVAVRGQRRSARRARPGRAAGADRPAERQRCGAAEGAARGLERAGFLQAGAPPQWPGVRRAGLLHPLVCGAGHRRLRRRHHARQHLRLGGRARQRVRRPVPSGKVERRRAAHPTQLSRSRRSDSGRC